MSRCLTLLETLIALVLVAALAVIVVPSLLSNLDERSFEDAADATNEQLMLARAHAQATGTPVEVTYIADKSQVQARLFVPFRADDITSDDKVGSSQSSPSTIDEAWASRTLNRSVRLTSRPPNPTQSSYIDEGAFETYLDEQEIWDVLGTGHDVRLALFMPDGTALVADQVWMNDDGGRRGVFIIDPWSGLPLFQRLANQTAQSRQTNSAAESVRGDRNR